jgi:hypothetical protein
MKKVFIVIGVLALCFAPLSLFADNEATDQGSLEFGLGPILSVYLYKGNLEGTTLIIGSGSTRFNFGYFITDNFSIGGFVYFASVKYEGYTESATEFGVGPTLTFYVPITDRFLFGIIGSFGFVSWEDPGDVDRSRMMEFGGGGNITYLITDNLGISGGLGILFYPNYIIEGIEALDTSFTEIFVGLGFSVYI